MSEQLPLEMNSLAGKKALALVREADFAHPGDKAAIDFVFKHLPRDSGKRILDAGSGLGATAEAIRHEGWGKVSGIDINQGSVVYANETYQRCHFVHGDVAKVDQLLEPGFDIVVSFCAFYAFPEQGAALEALARVSNHDAQLAIFDYVDRGNYAYEPILENGKPFIPHPIHIDKIESLLEQHGWHFYTIEPMHAQFQVWYAELLERIEAKKEAIRKKTSEGFYEHMMSMYGQLHAAVADNRLGGAIVRATHGKAG